MANNIVDKIGSNVTVWTNDGNGMENRTLLTVDTFGIVVTGYNDASKAVFVPWVQVKYVDYPNDSHVINTGDYNQTTLTVGTTDGDIYSHNKDISTGYSQYESHT